MQDKLRQRYQVQKEVSRGGRYVGNIRVTDMSRLAEFLYSEDATVEAEFEFSQSDYGSPMVKGNLTTILMVECQRCMKAMEKPLSIDFNLLVDADDEIVAESKLDTTYSEDGYLDIFEVVEDELILGLPLVNLHADKGCNEYWPTQDEQAELKRENPFSVLSKLKTN